MQPPSRVLVPVDLESVSWEPLDVAGWLAAQAGAITDLFYVLPTSYSDSPSWRRAHEELLSILVLLTERYALKTAQDSNNRREPVFVGNMQAGDPVELILEFAERCGHDVIVMGTDGRGGGRDVRNDSITETVMRRALSPVLVVPKVRADDLSETPAHL